MKLQVALPVRMNRPMSSLLVMTLQLVAIGLLVGGTAAAQTARLQCSLFETPLNVRAEGQAELLGDINYVCQSSDLGLPGPAASVIVNMLVDLNVPVTNNINGVITDAVLIVNENNCTNPSVVGGATSCGSGAYQDPQYGELLNDGRTIAWDSVSVPFPGEFNASLGGPNPDITRIRITSMRGNASVMGLPDGGDRFPITAILETQPPTGFGLSPHILNVGYARRRS